MEDDNYQRLTLHEIEVMLLVARGYTDKRVARELKKSVNTVREQVRASRRKLGARTRAQAVATLLRLTLPVK